MSKENPAKDEFWRERLPHLSKLPRDLRVSCIQSAISVWGPAPEDLREKIVELMKPDPEPAV